MMPLRAETGPEMPPPEFETYLKAGSERGLKWTALRLQVLDRLWRDQLPWGPYDLSKAMRQGDDGPFPNSVYRVLRSLQEAGLVVPIVSSKKFRISPDPACADWGVFICTGCRSLTLTPLQELAASLRQTAATCNFDARDVTIECEGECKTCLRTAQATMADTVRRLGWVAENGAANALLFATTMTSLVAA